MLCNHGAMPLYHIIKLMECRGAIFSPSRCMAETRSGQKLTQQH